ncbi:anthrone oxygenase family protein [Actinotalea solisilvae]|uniref:anthrone oxygenase family protein n=1 Tax=Actinotalea solisilvae TaxID=2072922 RepID=UPI0018F1782B|nr:anthrone oxygenase family protein [Actinotalea solisilvae]
MSGASTVAGATGVAGTADVALLATALACALVGGVLYAFSAFVMRGLGSLPPAGGLAAMQAINRAALRVPVIGPLLVTALACVGVAVAGLRGGEPWAVAGAALFVVGTVGVTGAANVPRNEALAVVDAADPAAAARWAVYLREWVAWNHVRTVAALGAAVSLVGAAVA